LENVLFSALIGWFLLGADLVLGVNALDQHRETLGKLEPPIEIEYRERRLGARWLTWLRRQIDGRLGAGEQMMAHG
jgi:hypothetical protein